MNVVAQKLQQMLRGSAASPDEDREDMIERLQQAITTTTTTTTTTISTADDPSSAHHPVVHHQQALYWLALLGTTNIVCHFNGMLLPYYTFNTASGGGGTSWYQCGAHTH
jgi:hypothetical protein